MSRLMKNKGFTLIELLVVIAIIGILSSIVLASLNRARDRGIDAKIKSQMAGIRASAELYYDANGDYGIATADCALEIFADEGIATYINAMPIPANAVCGSSDVDPIGYAVKYPLVSSTDYWCVDSTGVSGQFTGPIAGSTTVCP